MIKDKLLACVGWLPFWKVCEVEGCESGPRQRPFIVTYKDVWFFGWIKCIVNVRFKNELPGEFE